MAKRSTVLVTRPEYEKARRVFEMATKRGLTCRPAPAAEAGLAEAVVASEARHVVIGVGDYTGPLYAALPTGGVIARFGVGHDGVDKALASRRGLLCTNTPGALDDSVAEFVMTLILTVSRHTPALTAGVRDHRWEPRVGRELRGRTLAIVGCGAIGCRLARMAEAGFGMRVIGHDIRDLDETELCREFGFASFFRDFAEAVREAEFVSLHLPATANTRHFMNGDRLRCLREDAWLINTARGAVVCEDDLYLALQSGGLGGAALDVFEQEPYAPTRSDRDLRDLRTCIMTPHVASSTREACHRMADRALGNIDHAEQGDWHQMDLLNPEALNEPALRAVRRPVPSSPEEKPTPQ